jgi:hypothetical protein
VSATTTPPRQPPSRERSAVDVISPAMTRARNLMFPFRWSSWWRLGLVGLITGEMNSCGGGFNPGGFSGSHGGSGGHTSSPFPTLPHAAIVQIFVVLAVGIVVLVLVHMYLASVVRFALFDTVALRRFHLRESWSRRHEQGLRFYGFNLLFGMIFWVPIACLGFFLWRIFRQPAAARPDTGAIVLFVVLAVLLMMVVFLIATVFYVLVKDFTIPVIAIENTSMSRAIGRVWQLVRARPGSFAGYLGMKILLAIAAGIVMGVINLFLVLIFLIPTIIIGIAVGVSWPHILQSPALIALFVTIGAFVLLLLLMAIAILSSPLVAFFESYALEFFAGRYPPLWDILYPPLSPAATPVPVPSPA